MVNVSHYKMLSPGHFVCLDIAFINGTCLFAMMIQYISFGEVTEIHVCMVHACDQKVWGLVETNIVQSFYTGTMRYTCTSVGTSVATLELM